MRRHLIQTGASVQVHAVRGFGYTDTLTVEMASDDRCGAEPEDEGSNDEWLVRGRQRTILMMHLLSQMRRKRTHRAGSAGRLVLSDQALSKCWIEA